MNPTSPIIAYIDSHSGEIQNRLIFIYQIFKKAFPNAEETFAYQMPTFKAKTNLVHFAAYPQHIGIYPGPKVILLLKDKYPKILSSKGTWKIPHDIALPVAQFKALIRLIKATQK
jgi:uncharacterized protein YdhG (YjbR/CyaY superfamily)